MASSRGLIKVRVDDVDEEVVEKPAHSRPPTRPPSPSSSSTAQRKKPTATAAANTPPTQKKKKKQQLSLFDKLERFVKIKGLFLQCHANPQYKADNKELFMQTVLPFLDSTTLDDYMFWRQLDDEKRAVATDCFELLGDPGIVSFDIPSKGAAVYVVLSGRAAVDYYDSTGGMMHKISSMGRVFGAVDLFDDPLGRKRMHDKEKDKDRKPIVTRIVATMEPKSHLLRLNITDFIIKVLGINPLTQTTESGSSSGSGGGDLQYLDPLRHLDPVRRALKPLLPPDLYAFFDHKKIFLPEKDQEQAHEAFDKDWTRADRKKCFVDAHKKFDRLVFSANKMPEVGFIVMQGRVRLLIERMHTVPPLVRQSAADRALFASVTGGPSPPLSPDGIGDGGIGGGGANFDVGDAFPGGGSGSGRSPTKYTTAQPARERYSPGKMVSITTKLLPLNDFDPGSVVFLRAGCYGPRPAQTKNKVVRIGGARADSPDNLPSADWSSLNSSPPPSSSSSSSIAVPKRRQPPPPWVQHELIFEFLEPTTLLVVPQARVVRALEQVRDEVSKRQASDDVPALLEYVYRADAVVRKKLISLETWLNGEGVTVCRKLLAPPPTHDEIRQLKNWTFDMWTPVDKKMDLKATVEHEEEARFYRARTAAQDRLDMQLARDAAFEPLALPPGTVANAELWSDDLFRLKPTPSMRRASHATESGKAARRASTVRAGGLSHPTTRGVLPPCAWKPPAAFEAGPPVVALPGATAPLRNPLPAAYLLEDLSFELKAKKIARAVTMDLYLVNTADGEDDDEATDGGKRSLFSKGSLFSIGSKSSYIHL